MAHSSKCLPVLRPVVLLFLSVFLVPCPSAAAQDINKDGGPDQWRSVGGYIVFSTKHDFNHAWTRSPGTGMFWKDDEDRSRPATHSAAEVDKNIEAKKGEITVRGPGFLGRVLRKKGSTPRCVLKDPETGKQRGCHDLGGAEMYMAGGKWTGKWVPQNSPIFDPEKAPRGSSWVPDGKTVTCEVWMSLGFTSLPTWSGYGATGAEADIWFFPGPGRGGKVIKVIGPDGKEIDTTNLPVPPDPNKPTPDPNKPTPDPNKPTPDPDKPTPDPNAPVDRLRVRAEDRQVTPDTAVTVPVWLEFPKEFPRTRDGRVNVANLNAEIAYDPRVVKPAAKVIAGNLLGGALFQANTAKAGVIQIGFAAKQGVQTNGTLAQIPFQVVGQPGQRSPLKVTITTVNDDAGGTPAVTAIDGSIQIMNAAVIGDINGNGIVDAGDALAALKMSVDLMKEDLILNVDKLNGVTSNDARLLLKMAVQGNIAPPRTVEGGSGSSGTAPATPANSAASGGNVASLPTQGPDSVAARKAYQEYITVYNRMTSLMAAGKGDTPEARKAHEEFLRAKTKYEAAIAERPAETD